MAVPTPLTTTYKETNGSAITTDIYLPPQQNGVQDYPVLINIHGGAFMLGHSKLISLPQVSYALEKGWIVLCPDHRLCPGVNLQDGPVNDMRDFMEWVYDDTPGNGLDGFLEKERGGYKVDKDKVMAFGTSSGGFLAMELGFSPRPPAAILNFYGAVHFSHESWKQAQPHILSILPADGFSKEFLESVYSEYPVPTTSGISLEGKPDNKPDFTKARDAFAFTQIGNGGVLDAIFPSKDGDIRSLDPVGRVDRGFPPTFIVHGDADRMVSVEVSRELYRVLQEKGVESELLEVPGEDHTFALGMEVGSLAWRESMKGFEWLERVISRV